MEPGKDKTKYETLKERNQAGENLYPYDFKETISIGSILSFVDKNQITPENYASNHLFTDMKVSTGGRVVQIASFKGLSFVQIESYGQRIQVLSKAAEDLSRGDIVGVTGRLGYSRTGQLSIIEERLRVLAPCLHVYPTQYYKLKDTESIYRQRYLDLVLNKESLKVFITRSKVISFIRKFLDMRGFLEVETPMMQTIPGGAAAKPFKTLLNEMQLELSMRVSPELFLKTLLVGGIPRVYELGKEFRNEGIDATHNPEFTSCEFYMAYADYNDVLVLTEELLSSLVMELFGTRVLEYTVENRDTKKKTAVKIDFTTPFRRVDILEELSREVGVEIAAEALETDEGRELLDRLCRERNIRCRAPRTTTRLLDKLVGEYLETKCHHPTFLMNHPKIMSPLAKEHRERKFVTERFELFILQKEVCNAYTELNNPFDQRERFEQQARDKSAGDEEAHEIDEPFCTALEYGMPPAGGWGIGIDRLVMMLTGATNIRDVLFFPTMKPVSQ